MKYHRLLNLDSTFYDDHVSRDLAVGHEVEENRGRVVQVRMPLEAEQELLDDARHYADPSMVAAMGNTGFARSLQRSAEKVIAAILNYPTPEDVSAAIRRADAAWGRDAVIAGTGAASRATYLVLAEQNSHEECVAYDLLIEALDEHDAAAAAL